MKERTFEDILYMIKRSCDKNFYKGTDYDGLKPEIVRCATNIYIEQMRQNGGKEDEQKALGNMGEYGGRMTNSEKIRNMTDEELATVLICPAGFDLNYNINYECKGEEESDCLECIKQWLQSEEV